MVPIRRPFSAGGVADHRGGSSSRSFRARSRSSLASLIVSLLMLLSLAWLRLVPFQLTRGVLRAQNEYGVKM